MQSETQSRRCQKGFVVLMVVLMALGLGVSLAAMLSTGADAVETMQDKAIADKVVSQMTLIQAQILKCGAEFPDGNNGGGGRFIKYPLANGSYVGTLICPGSGRNIWADVEGGAPTPPFGGVSSYTFGKNSSGIYIALATTSASTSRRTELFKTICRRVGKLLDNAASNPGGLWLYVAFN